MRIDSVVFLSTNTLICNSVINVICEVINLNSHAFLLWMSIIAILLSPDTQLCIPNLQHLCASLQSMNERDESFLGGKEMERLVKVELLWRENF